MHLFKNGEHLIKVKCVISAALKLSVSDRFPACAYTHALTIKDYGAL